MISIIGAVVIVNIGAATLMGITACVLNRYLRDEFFEGFRIEFEELDIQKH